MQLADRKEGTAAAITPKPPLPHTLDPTLDPEPNRCEDIVLRFLRCSTATRYLPQGAGLLQDFEELADKVAAPIATP